MYAKLYAGMAFRFLRRNATTGIKQILMDAPHFASMNLVFIASVETSLLHLYVMNYVEMAGKWVSCHVTMEI